MFSYLVYSRDTVVYIRVWKTFPRLLYLDERCGNCWSKNSHSTRLLCRSRLRKIQVGNDQEKAQSEKDRIEPEPI